jgi:hypothetical protein
MALLCDPELSKFQKQKFSGIVGVRTAQENIRTLFHYLGELSIQDDSTDEDVERRVESSLRDDGKVLFVPNRDTMKLCWMNVWCGYLPSTPGMVLIGQKAKLRLCDASRPSFLSPAGNF